MKLLALLAQFIIAQSGMWPNPGPGRAPWPAGGGGTDFSDDAGCIAFYNFEGSGGTALADKCASGTVQNLSAVGAPNPGITSSAPCTTNGSSGSQCYVHSGAADSNLQTADHADFNQNPITFGCMGLKNDATQTSNFIAHLDFGGSTGGQGFWLGISNTELPFARVSDGSAATSGERSLDTWYSVIARWASAQNGGAVQLFVDGVLLAASLPETDIEDSTVPLTIGKHASGIGDYLDGAVDDCFVYAGYLTDAEICAIANFGFSGTDSDRGHGC